MAIQFLLKNSNLTLIFYVYWAIFCTKPNCREVPFFLENANKIDFCAKWWQVFGHQGHDFASMTFCEGQNCAKTTLELWNIEVNIRFTIGYSQRFFGWLLKVSQVDFAWYIHFSFWMIHFLNFPKKQRKIWQIFSLENKECSYQQSKGSFL